MSLIFSHSIEELPELDCPCKYIPDLLDERRKTYRLQRHTATPAVSPSHYTPEKGYIPVHLSRLRCVRLYHYWTSLASSSSILPRLLPSARVIPILSHQYPRPVCQPSLMLFLPLYFPISPTLRSLPTFQQCFPHLQAQRRENKINSHAPIQTTNWNPSPIVITRQRNLHSLSCTSTSQVRS